jgi:hypothetical protein
MLCFPSDVRLLARASDYELDLEIIGKGERRWQQGIGPVQAD